MKPRDDDREEVLASIRNSLDSDRDEALRRRPKRSRPEVANVQESLVERLRSGGCTVEVIDDIEILPERVSEVMKRDGLGKHLAVADKKLSSLDWKASGLAATHKWSESLKVAVTNCMGAIAETGQFLVANDCEDAKLSLLADTHVVLIDAVNVRATLGEIEEMLGQEPPGVVTMISGPSRTADIEQTLVMGAHGPRRIEAFILNIDDKNNAAKGRRKAS